MASWREETKQSQYIKFCLLGSVFDYMSIILMYQSSFLNGSLLIFILMNTEFLLNQFTFIFLRLLLKEGLWGGMEKDGRIK